MKAIFEGAFPIEIHQSTSLQKTRSAVYPTAGGYPFNPLTEPSISAARTRLIIQLCTACREKRIYSDHLIEEWHIALTAFILQRTIDGAEPENIATEIHDLVNTSLTDDTLLFQTPPKQGIYLTLFYGRKS